MSVLLPVREGQLVTPGSIAARYMLTTANLNGGSSRRWAWETPPSGGWPWPITLMPRTVWLGLVLWIMQGDPNRMVDGHSEVADTDIRDHSAITGAGVSSLAIDAIQGSGTDEHGGSYSGIHLTLESEGDDGGRPYHYTIVPSPQVGVGYKIVMRARAGLASDSTPGQVTVWAAQVGQPFVTRPVVDLQAVNSCWPGQSCWGFIFGPYNRGGNARGRWAAPRFGRTLAEMVADGTDGFIDGGQVPAYGPYDLNTQVGSFDTAGEFDAAAVAPIAGVTPPPPSGPTVEGLIASATSHFQKTTVGYVNKKWAPPPPAGTEWKAGLDELAQAQQLAHSKGV